MQAFATFKTDQAHRHADTLRHHFGAKVETTQTGSETCIFFPFGNCELVAFDKCLELRAEAKDKTQLDEVVEVITRHLERFAFRENPRLTWYPPAEANQDGRLPDSIKKY